MLSSTEAAWMVSYEVMGGPLADASVWRGALLWAIALYVPLSAPAQHVGIKPQGE